VKILRRVLPLVLVVMLVGIHALLHHAGCLHAGVPAPRSDRLRVVSWNLRNFPGEHDRARMVEQLDRLDPHVLALQEIRDPAALRSLRPPRWRWIASEHGGSHGPQRLVVGWDPTEVEVLDPMEHPSLSMGGRVRPALSVYVRPANGPDFHLFVVHFKATRQGHEVRREQWSLLEKEVTSRRAEGPVLENDVIVVGDFNVAGGPQTSSSEERALLEASLDRAGLTPWEIVSGCTAYWDGSRRDTWWEPSRLDLVWSAGMDEVPGDARRAWPGTHCALHRCATFSASEDHPEPDYHGISDHCPVVIDLPRHDDEP